MLHRATPRPLLLAALVGLALSALQPARADDTWNYLAVKSKEEAVAKATGVPLSTIVAAVRTQGASAARKAGGLNITHLRNTTSGQSACTEAMFNNWAAHFNITLDATQRPAALQRFCDNMERVRAINADPSISFW